MASKINQFSGPGFVAVFFDIPFPISIPNGAYLTYDPQKTVACVQTNLREGSRAFFRNRPIIGPTSYQDLAKASQEQERPRKDRSYLQTNVSRDKAEKVTLNIHSGVDGGYAECKYYSEICVTFLADDIGMINDSKRTFARVCEIANPFLEKYMLINEVYRISRVSLERNFYFATCQTSPLTAEEVALRPRELFDRLEKPRTFFSELGKGAANILRTNSFELLGPRNELKGKGLEILKTFVLEPYETPLSYDFIMESLRYLQRYRDYRLSIVHAETAFEVHVSGLLAKLMVVSGTKESKAWATIENDKDYWGIKKRTRKLDEWTKDYCAKNGLAFGVFMDSSLYKRWETDLYKKRNSAVHAGASAFSYGEASVAIGVAKECIVFLEARIPGLSDQVHLNPSMAGFRENAGEVMF